MDDGSHDASWGGSCRGASHPWYRDLGVLLRRPDEFWPTREQAPAEQLNSIVRLLAYCTVAVFAAKPRAKYLAFGLAAIVAVSLLHDDDDPMTTTHRHRRRRSSVECGAPAAIAVAVRDAAADHQTPRRACTLSTPDNPFANMLLSDLAGDPSRPPACKYEQHKDLIRENFNRGLPRNVYDIYEKENSQRQFMTMPVTTSSPDTIAFAQFCYGNAGRPTCKEDPSRCTGSFP